MTPLIGLIYTLDAKDDTAPTYKEVAIFTLFLCSYGTEGSGNPN